MNKYIKMMQRKGGILRRNVSLVVCLLLLICLTYAFLWQPPSNQPEIDMSVMPQAQPQRIVITAKNHVTQMANEKSSIHDDNIKIPIVRETHLKDNNQDATSTQAWLHRRQEVLSSTRPRKVLLFCYMRGGSTFFSELFVNNPDAMFWYEPLDGFYSATYGLQKWSFPMHTFYSESTALKTPTVRHYPDWEKALIAEFHHNIVNCNFGDLPVDLLAHSGSLGKSSRMAEYQACRKVNHVLTPPCGTGVNKHGLKVCGGTIATANRALCAQKLAIVKQRYGDPTSALQYGMNITQSTPYTEKQLEPFTEFANCQNNLRSGLMEHCIPNFNNRCTNFKLVAHKSLRITMDSVKDILEKDPDTFVVYLVRDPRGTALSTKGARLMSTYSGPQKRLDLEANYLCSKMKHDLELYKQYQQLYPGAIHMVRYEDLAREPEQISQQIYDFIGVPIHNDVLQWITNSQNATNKGGGTYSTSRADWTASINKWRHNISEDVANKMSAYCKDVLEMLDYPLT